MRYVFFEAKSPLRDKWVKSYDSNIFHELLISIYGQTALLSQILNEFFIVYGYH